MSDSSVPLFSVVIPAYKAERFIRQTLRSVYRQTVRDLEIVAVHDGSPDGTLELLRRETDERLRIIDQPNGGECSARNRGIREARGVYVAFLDSDDAWLPDHLELALAFFSAHPEMSWYSTGYRRVETIGDADLKPSDPGEGGYYAVNWFLEGVERTSSSNAVLRRAAIRGDLFPVGVRMFGDNVGWCRFALEHPMMGTIDRCTALYRQWGGSATDEYLRVGRGAASGVEMDVLRLHAEMASSPGCPEAARLFFHSFSLSNWWLRITSASLIGWLPEIRERRRLSGRGVSCWLKCFCYLNHWVIRCMRWGVRRRLNGINRKRRKLADKSRMLLS